MADFSNSKPGDRVRYYVAILMSLGILVVWTVLFDRPPVSPPITSTVNRTNQSASAENSGIVNSSSLTESTAGSQNNQVNGNDTVQSLLDEPFKEEIITLENDSLTVQISTLGGVVRNAVLRFQATKSTIEKESGNLEEIHYPGYSTGNVFFTEPNTIPPKVSPFRVLTNYKNSSSQDELVLVGKENVNGQDVTITKTFILSNYHLVYKIGFSDNLNQRYYLANGAGLTRSKEKNSFYDIITVSHNVGDTITTPLSQGILGFFSTPPDLEWVRSAFDWISVDDRFYARVLRPMSASDTIATSYEAFFMHKSIGEESFNIGGVVGNALAGEQQFEIYYLPKSRNLLDYFYDSKGQYFFNLFHQYGFMRIISSVMYAVIEFINGFVFNYGWSIILMTILLKLLVFPLQQKSFKSMQRMQELSPKIKAIRENFKNKPQKMNAELMQLYRKEGVNPLGGCLPMLIPLPVFIALYSLFNNMVEIQGSSFLWINDLALPDKLFSFGTTLPLLGTDFHLLPIIVVISSFLQSYFTPQAPTTPENRQQMMIMKYMMPFMFFFISWNMSSALILYWTAQNVFSVAQVLLIKRNKPVST